MVVRESVNQPRLMALASLDLPTPWGPTRTSIWSNFRPGSYTRATAAHIHFRVAARTYSLSAARRWRTSMVSSRSVPSHSSASK